MDILSFQKHILEDDDRFGTAYVNFKAHTHVVEFAGHRCLTYFNQPVLVEYRTYELYENGYKLSKEQFTSGHPNIVVLPFPCKECFCPSFNTKTSLFIDIYREAHAWCKKQFEGTMPVEYQPYEPTSIRCMH